MSEQDLTPDPDDIPTPSAEPPTPSEPKPVEVSPADQSDLKKDRVLGKSYTVDPERGYRRS